MMEDPKDSKEQIDSTDLDSNNMEESTPSPNLTEGKELVKGVSKFLFKAARKVGFIAYDLATDEMLSNAEKMRRASKIQRSHRLSELSDEELVSRVQNTDYSPENFAAMKELSERHGKENSFLENYGVSKRVEFLGVYVTEDKNVTILIDECSDVKMQFFIVVVEPPKKLTYCIGKFFGKKKVLFSGKGCTITMTWDSEESFILKGKVPWEQKEVKLYFTRSSNFDI